MRAVTRSPRRLVLVIAAGILFMTLGAWLLVDQPAQADLIWRKVFLAAWMSWLSAFPVWASLILMRKRFRIGWLAYTVAAIMLVTVGYVLGQWGFCAIGTVNVYLAVKGWLSWGKPTPNEQRLERELSEARAEIVRLRRAGHDREAIPA